MVQMVQVVCVWFELGRVCRFVYYGSGRSCKVRFSLVLMPSVFLGL